MRADFDAIASAVSPGQLAEAIGAKKSRGDEYHCPNTKGHSNGDRSPSLSISRPNGRTVVFCHGCGLTGSPVQVAAEIWGITPADSAERLAGFAGVTTATTLEKPEIVDTYDYTDEEGTLLYQVVRFSPKDFRQRRPDGNRGWIWKLGNARRVLYRLPEVPEAVALNKPVYIAEGEKDVHTLEKAGAVATCNAGGAGKWRSEYSEVLRGATVRIVSDKDEPGRKHARDVANALWDVAASVEVFEAKEGKDASDHLQAGHGLEDFVPIREGVEEEPPSQLDAFPLLSDLLNNPELLLPPKVVLPHLGWRGRTTGLIGPDKSGKSTIAAHGIAALTKGGAWLNSHLDLGRAVVAAPDEAVGDTVRRVHELGATPDRVRILALRPPDLLASLDAVLKEHPADLVVVDSLAEWARLTLGTAPDDGDTAGWGAVVRPLVALSRTHDCALLLLHHPRRSDGQYRGSGEIAAALDCLWEMTMPHAGEDPTLRRFRGRARWPVENFSLRMEGGWFHLGGGGAVAIETRVLLDVEANPGTTRAESYRRLGGRKANHTKAVGMLIQSGVLVERSGGLFHPRDVEVDLL